jgi:hypothetical protein
MRNIFLILFLSIFWAFYSQSQPVLFISGQVLDLENFPIPNVTVSFKNKLTKTSENGNFLIPVNEIKSIDIDFNHSGFKKYKLSVSSRKLRRNVNDTLFLPSINLYNLLLDEFSVIANKIDTVYGSDRFSVEDFEMVNDGQMLLLSYEKTLRKESKILLLDKNQQLLHTHVVPGQSIRLFKDYSGQSYVITIDKVFQINVSNINRIELNAINNDVFYDYCYRIIDTISDDYLYSNFNELYPAIKFYSSSKIDSTHSLIKEVKDDFMMELYRAQYKYVSGRDKLWAYRKEQQTGIDKEIWVGASVFTNDILYKPIYAPLFVKNDSIYLFDHYQNYIYSYNSAIELLDSIPITYHLKSKNEKWSQPLIQDEKEKDIFVLFNSGGFYIIKKIDKGKVNRGFKLTNRYVENMKIYDGYVYYVYRPYESIQKKFIYKEKIPR